MGKESLLSFPPEILYILSSQLLRKEKVLKYLWKKMTVKVLNLTLLNFRKGIGFQVVIWICVSDPDKYAAQLGEAAQLPLHFFFLEDLLLSRWRHLRGKMKILWILSRVWFANIFWYSLPFGSITVADNSGSGQAAQCCWGIHSLGSPAQP